MDRKRQNRLLFLLCLIAATPFLIQKYPAVQIYPDNPPLKYCLERSDLNIQELPDFLEVFYLTLIAPNSYSGPIFEAVDILLNLFVGTVYSADVIKST